MEITFLGDVYLPKKIESRLELSQVVVLNLEYPITEYKRAYPKKVNLKAEVNYLRNVFGNRIIIANLANNHIIDYGERGFRDTLKSLEDEDILFFGAGYKKDNFHNPLVLKIGQSLTAFIGYADESSSPVYARKNKPGASELNLVNIERDILKAKKAGAEYIVASLHWGAQDVKLPNPVHQRLARQIIDFGADLIIGHHAHCIQPIEWYKDELICYGLGNAVFPEIDVASDYDEKGASLKQQKWNNESLLVYYNFADSTCKFSKSRFEKGVLKLINNDFNPLKLKRVISSAKFRYEFTKAKLKNMILSFYNEPKMIKKRHLDVLRKVIFPSKFK